MMETTFLIGNGLGMAIDPDYFKIESGIEKAIAQLSVSEKQYILNLIPSGTLPFKESDLELLQRTIWSCQNLKALESGTIEWLSHNARNFPDAFDKFKHLVAVHFFEYSPVPGHLFYNFMTNLSNLICGSNTVNIATLNYDGLLYKFFIDATPPLFSKLIFGRYDNTCLLDGLTGGGFDEENLVKIYYQFGYYLHLHGTPLAFDKNDIIFKRHLYEVSDDRISKHIVLTHEKHKSDIIPNSYLLDTYWLYFKKCLIQSNKLIIFGYSGNDPHVNNVIKNRIKKNNIQIVIIQHEMSRTSKEDWENALETKLESESTYVPNKNIFISLSSILTFNPLDIMRF